MSDTNFKVGDTVVTKAGDNYSPVMTIKWIESENCLCIWYNKITNHFEEYKFPNEMLQRFI